MLKINYINYIRQELRQNIKYSGMTKRLSIYINRHYPPFVLTAFHF